MKDSTIIVRIPEPCHEDWNKMTPDDKGRFCSSCSKSVFDFSNKTDSEICTVLVENEGKKLCGHFKKSQIDRPLSITIDLKNLPKNMSITKIFGIALFLAFGTVLFSCTDHEDKKITAIETVSTEKKPEQESRGIMGMMMSMPLENLKENEITTTVITESYVNGGIRAEEVVAKNDSLIEAQVLEKEGSYLGGMVCVIYRPPVTDSSDVQNTDSILNSERIKTSGTFLNKETELTVYPNPGNGEFNLKYEVTKRNDVRVDVLDMNGMLIRNIVNVNSQYEGRYNIPVNLSDLPNGTYLVSLLNNGKRSVEKLIIAK